MQLLRASSAFLAAFSLANLRIVANTGTTVPAAPFAASNPTVQLAGSPVPQGTPAINSGPQTVSFTLANGGSALPASAITAEFVPPALGGKIVRTDANCVTNATDDLAVQLLALGWTSYTPGVGYGPIPVSD